MTIHEATDQRKSLLEHCKTMRESGEIWARDVEALDIAIAALRGPTREQVEKAWKGEWINKHSAYDHKIFTCAQCGKQISIQGENLDFCPKCGSTQTDEAVEILLKRLEALKDGTTD